ncbi:MAG: hypothetical protein R2862_02990 [Thermoanaerobaculia bacterium]
MRASFYVTRRASFRTYLPGNAGIDRRDRGKDERTRGNGGLLLLAGLPGTGARIAGAAEGPEIRIARAATPIAVDGDLADEAWKSAEPIVEWYETNPGDNVPPQVRSVGYLAYDDQFLYAAFEFDEPDPPPSARPTAIATMSARSPTTAA